MGTGPLKEKASHFNSMDSHDAFPLALKQIRWGGWIVLREDHGGDNSAVSLRESFLGEQKKFQTVGEFILHMQKLQMFLPIQIRIFGIQIAPKENGSHYDKSLRELLVTFRSLA